MGNETIFYYVTEEFLTGCKRNVKTYFWQKIKLNSYLLEEEKTIVTVMVPQLQKGWKKDRLLRQMQEILTEYQAYSENAEIVMQPAIQQILMQQDTFPTVFWELSKRLFAEQFSKMLSSKARESVPDSVVLLLGESFFPEEQIQRFSDMIQPYLPYINCLTILYESEDDAGKNMDTAMETDTETDSLQTENRWVEVIHEYTEELYYSYGLVTQVQSGRDFLNNRYNRYHIRNGQSTALFLDYGYLQAVPLRMLQAGDIYLDVVSSEKKESLFRRKCAEISYLSPRKYLDTTVKSGYDKLVNQASCRK